MKYLSNTDLAFDVDLPEHFACREWHKLTQYRCSIQEGQGERVRERERERERETSENSA